ncbi:hypothetical protein IMG5_116770 [Ichthyophthirius multifiliis]|uniref:Transmembrane protein n=1 Tax=Ichthyophthirius multifiliis TaxID=5932 RepID=G0QUF1_ICHMU|nr:hypothetical protein IMG5_116770 [Ichthyophthirius multifiliis]EGR31147.1 hypothetical protein IMG5_116770 [Ichthyophthirius multifiliis]|eukprot:XP_004034633.1 hypothetical protein IMG5_116770 [Ichthyophthirius multifiliis]
MQIYRIINILNLKTCNNKAKKLIFKNLNAIIYHQKILVALDKKKRQKKSRGNSQKSVLTRIRKLSILTKIIIRNTRKRQFYTRQKIYIKLYIKYRKISFKYIQIKRIKKCNFQLKLLSKKPIFNLQLIRIYRLRKQLKKQIFLRFSIIIALIILSPLK